MNNGEIEQNHNGTWDVVFDDGERIVGLSSLSDAIAFAYVEDETSLQSFAISLPEGAMSDFQLPNGRWLRQGTEVSIQGVRGRFVFQHARNNEVTVFGGTQGREMFRTFTADRIKTVHSKDKVRRNIDRKNSMWRSAHQMPDPSVIAHCPFCGSGDLVARSDGNTECIYCNRFFSVSEQPEFNAEPGHPSEGLIDGQEDSDSPVVEELQSAPAFVAPDETQNEEPQDVENPVVQAQSSKFITVSGAKLSKMDYIKHLAFRHGDRENVIRNLSGGE